MADAATVTPLKDLSKRAVKESRFIPADQIRNVWSVVPEEGTPISAMLDPAYWTHVARRLRPSDLIEVRAEDGSFFAVLYVHYVERLSAKVSVLSQTIFDAEATPTDDANFDVMWKGPHHRHAIVRKSDKRTIQHGFESREAAMHWLADNMKALVA